MRVLVPFIAAAVPLLISPRLFFHFDITPKIAIFLFGADFLLIFCIWGLWGPFRAFLRTRIGFLFDVLLALQWLWVALATVFSTHWQLSMNGSSWRRYGFITITALLIYSVFTAAWLANDHRRVYELIRVLVGAGALAALYGIAQYFSLDPFQNAQSYQVGEPPFTIVRPPGTIGNADYFAAWLLPIAFFGVISADRESTRWARAAYYTVSGVVVTAIGLSGTRAAILGLAAGSSVYLILRRVRLTFRAFALVACGLICCGLFVISPAGARVRARLYWSSQDAFGGARVLLWRDSIRMILARSGFGYGPETFATEFPRMQSVELARAYPDFYHESPHNFLLDSSVDQGVPAMLLLIATIGLATYAGYSACDTKRNLAAPLLAALTAVVVCQQFIVFVLPTALSFYLLVAMLVAIAVNPKPGESAARANRFVGITCFGAATAIGILSVRLCFADYAFGLAQRRIVLRDTDGATRAYTATLKWIPDGAGYNLSYSRAMFSLANASPVFRVRAAAFQQAFESGIRAAANAEDRQNAWYNLATLFAQKNDVTGVERSLRRAIALAPNWFKPHWTLAEVLAASGHRSEALAEAVIANDLDGGKHPEVQAFLSNIQKSNK